MIKYMIQSTEHKTVLIVFSEELHILTRFNKEYKAVQ